MNVGVVLFVSKISLQVINALLRRREKINWDQIQRLKSWTKWIPKSDTFAKGYFSLVLDVDFRSKKEFPNLTFCRLKCATVNTPRAQCTLVQTAADDWKSVVVEDQYCDVVFPKIIGVLLRFWRIFQHFQDHIFVKSSNLLLSPLLKQHFPTHFEMFPSRFTTMIVSYKLGRSYFILSSKTICQSCWVISP